MLPIENLLEPQALRRQSDPEAGVHCLIGKTPGSVDGLRPHYIYIRRERSNRWRRWRSICLASLRDRVDLSTVFAFVVRRLVLSVLVLLAVSFGTFWFFARSFNRLYGQPVLPLYWRWLKAVPSGGIGYENGISLWKPLLPALGHTLALLGASLLLVVVLALVLGTVAAVRHGSLLDVGLRAFSYVAWSVPAFLVGLILQAGFYWLGFHHGAKPFAISGWPGFCPIPGSPIPFPGPCAPAGSGLHYAVNLLRHLTLPAVSLAVGFVGLHTRYLRSSLLTARGSQYSVTARAKGLHERRVVLRHALRNSLVTFTSALLLDVGAIFGAALAVDWVFHMNGLGSLFIAEIATASLDPYAVQLLLMTAATLVVAASLLSDLAVPLLDPRARET
jgi:peptide/nickel transport system permease protein